MYSTYPLRMLHCYICVPFKAEWFIDRSVVFAVLLSACCRLQTIDGSRRFRRHLLQYSAASPPNCHPFFCCPSAKLNKRRFGLAPGCQDCDQVTDGWWPVTDHLMPLRLPTVTLSDQGITGDGAAIRVCPRC